MARHSKHSFEIGVIHYHGLKEEAYVTFHKRPFKHDKWNVIKLDCITDCIWELNNLYDQLIQENRTKDAEMRKARENV